MFMVIEKMHRYVLFSKEVMMALLSSTLPKMYKALTPFTCR